MSKWKKPRFKYPFLAGFSFLILSIVFWIIDSQMSTRGADLSEWRGRYGNYIPFIAPLVGGFAGVLLIIGGIYQNYKLKK